MTLVRRGTADTAPEWFCNASGQVSWSGKHVHELTAMQAIEMLNFCETEAYREGWNAELRGDKMDQREFLFHPNFLGGRPYAWWHHYQQMGREDYRSSAEVQPR